MIPFVLAAVGGYLIGNSFTKKYAKGGIMPSGRVFEIEEYPYRLRYVDFMKGMEYLLQVNVDTKEELDIEQPVYIIQTKVSKYAKSKAVVIYENTIDDFVMEYKKRGGKYDLQYSFDKFLDNQLSNKFSNGGVMYADLSKQNPQVVTDSEVKDLPEFELKKIGNVEYLKGYSKIQSSRDAYSIFKSVWNKNQIEISEHFNILLLNRANKPIGFVQLAKGGIDGVVADVEIICKYAVDSLAKGVLVAHNHPSGNLQPSAADDKIMAQLNEALKTFNITLVDSLIITTDGYYSYKDESKL